jgi:EAL domain-containing protein (putative c-di-GMP-specific phosphodiesterase class I)/GGDEF domain-containing protein
LNSIRKELFLGIFFGVLGLLLVFWVLYSFINRIVIDQEVNKARLESKTIYHFRNYLATVSPHIQRKDNNISFFACTPAYTVNQVAKLIREKENFYIRQVSDRWRNPHDKPNKHELEAIKYFKTHKDAKEFWEVHEPHKHLGMGADEKHIFYAYPLKIEKSCLLCHGDPKKDVPLKIYNEIVKTYGNRAFGYKLGELRGIISIRIPFDKINQRIVFIFSVIAVVLFSFFGIGVFVFYSLNKRIQNDLNTLLDYFKNLISKGKYKSLNKKMKYKEFENLKEQINSTVDLIKKYQIDLSKRLYFNFLSGIHNREKFMDFINKNRDKNIILLNIDKFREINSFFGTEIGDELIKKVAKRLKELKKEYKFNLYHLDIDQFAIIPLKEMSKDNLKRFVEELLVFLEAPYKVNNNEIVVRFRAGISKNNYLDAEIALSMAKDFKQDVVIFDENTQKIKENYGENIKWLKKLKSAIENLRIVPFYQPIVDRDGKVIKYEALVRMIDEDGKVISPFFFLDVAKKSRLYNEITKIVIDKVIKTVEEKDVKVSINISLEDIEDEKMREYILNRVKECNKPHYLTFEIVENEDVRESKILNEFLHKLQNLGAEIYIDDFGSGYANFDYLLKLNPDGVKIDGSLIKDILDDKNNEIIVRTIVSFAKQTGIKTVAEFVENKEIFDKLKEIGIDYFQGYYFSPPLKDIKDKNENSSSK